MNFVLAVSIFPGFFIAEADKNGVGLTIISVFLCNFTFLACINPCFCDTRLCRLHNDVAELKNKWEGFYEVGRLPPMRIV